MGLRCYSVHMCTWDGVVVVYTGVYGWRRCSVHMCVWGGGVVVYTCIHGAAVL